VSSDIGLVECGGRFGGTAAVILCFAPGDNHPLAGNLAHGYTGLAFQRFHASVTPMVPTRPRPHPVRSPILALEGEGPS
jgi:hypothetical protein